MARKKKIDDFSEFEKENQSEILNEDWHKIYDIEKSNDLVNESDLLALALHGFKLSCQPTIEVKKTFKQNGKCVSLEVKTIGAKPNPNFLYLIIDKLNSKIILPPNVETNEDAQNENE